MLDRHPCFNVAAATTHSRVHLAVAPRCNLECNYCDRRYDCVNESRPGVTSRVLKPDEAVAYLASLRGTPHDPSVLGLAGPGDPLYNEETFQTLALVREAFPEKILCLSTNGLALPERAADLWELGVRFLTVTLNTLRPAVGAGIYRSVRLGRRTYRGEDGASRLLERQLEGLTKAKELGFTLKLNTVYLPGLNDGDLESIAWQARSLGAVQMNLMPLIPSGEFLDRPAPTHADVVARRRAIKAIIPQMSHCRQCRADAVGPLFPAKGETACSTPS